MALRAHKDVVTKGNETIPVRRNPTQENCHFLGPEPTGSPEGPESGRSREDHPVRPPAPHSSTQNSAPFQAEGAKGPQPLVPLPLRATGVPFREPPKPPQGPRDPPKKLQDPLRDPHDPLRPPGSHSGSPKTPSGSPRTPSGTPITLGTPREPHNHLRDPLRDPHNNLRDPQGTQRSP